MTATSNLVKLRRCDSGYETLDGRYVIERQDDLTECEHPMCDPLHRRFWTDGNTGEVMLHWVTESQWHVWDNEKNDYVSWEGRGFETKGAAHRWLTYHLEGEG